MICELLGVDEGSVPILPSEAFVNGQPNKQPSFNISSRSSVRTSRTFLVPTENVGSVIGKGGAFLQSVKDDSRASVIVRSLPTPHKPLFFHPPLSQKCWLKPASLCIQTHLSISCPPSLHLPLLILPLRICPSIRSFLLSFLQHLRFHMCTTTMHFASLHLSFSHVVSAPSLV